MKIKFEGRLQHCWFGTYSCRIVLTFNSSDDVRDCLKILKGNWNLGKNNYNLACQMDSDELESLKEKFKSWGMDEKNLTAIDSMRVSVDFGEPFFGEIPSEYVNKDQLTLF